MILRNDANVTTIVEQWPKLLKSYNFFGTLTNIIQCSIIMKIWPQKNLCHENHFFLDKKYFFQCHKYMFFFKYKDVCRCFIFILWILVCPQFQWWHWFAIGYESMMTLPWKEFGSPIFSWAPEECWHLGIYRYSKLSIASTDTRVLTLEGVYQHCQSGQCFFIIFSILLFLLHNLVHSSPKKFAGHWPPENCLVLQGISTQTLFKEFPVSMSSIYCAFNRI